MHLRLAIIYLIIICFTITDTHADEISCLTSPHHPIPNGEVTGEDESEIGFSPEVCFEDALRLYKEGNVYSALENFRFLADKRQVIGNPEIAGTSLLMTGHIIDELGLDGAELQFQQVISVYPLLADYAQFRSAESVERRGKPSEAAKLFKSVVDSYPDSGFHKKALLRSSKNFLTAGKTDEARTGFNTFMDIYPKDSKVPEVLYSIGMSYLREGRESDAQKYFRKIWVIHPVSKEARLVKTMIDPPLTAEEILRRGKSYYDSGFYEEAISEYKKFLSQKKGVTKANKTEAEFKIGVSYFRLRMSNEAEDRLERFLTKYSRDEKAPEAMYWLGRNYLRRGKVDAFITSSLEFLKRYKKDERSPEVLFRLGNIYAERNDIDNAFLYLDRVIGEYPLNSYASDSLWKKGWILYNTGNGDSALNIFNKIINSPAEHAYADQAIYWRAKILGKNGDYEAMNNDLCRLCNDYGKSFYCLFSSYYQDVACSSSVNNHPRPSALPETEKPELVSGTQNMLDQKFPAQFRDDSKNERELTRIRLFLYLGLRDEAVSEVIRLRNRIKSDKETSIMLASILSSLGEYNRAMYTIRPHIQSLKSDNNSYPDNRLWQLIYPAGYSNLITKHAARNNLDPFLVYAIIREESWFNKEAVSPAGALGLMQLMPGTAKRVAKESYAGRESLFDPEVNIELGTRFFADRLGQFDGNIFLAIASYNAGPEAVGKWMTKLDGAELDEFIENIPYKETREYVKKVFRSYMEYLRLYNEDTRIDTLL